MLSRAQQILLKRAQTQASLADDEYRDAIALVSGMADCRSSKDRRLTDGHVDKILGYFEAIYWRKVDAGEPLLIHCKPAAVFRQRGYWAEKNRRGNTSRDRYSADVQRTKASALEAELHHLGFGLQYVAAIQRNIQPFSLPAYIAALKRTLKSKQKTVDQPF